MAAVARSHGFKVMRKGYAFLKHVKGEKAALGTIASFYPDSNAIIFNEESQFYGDPVAQAARLRKRKWISTDHPLHPVLHELGHGLHYRAIGLDTYKRLRKESIPDALRALVKSEVSEYAATSPLEFVAEAYTSLRTGKKFSQPIMDYYAALKGPKA